MFFEVCESIALRCQQCVNHNGKHFEHPWEERRFVFNLSSIYKQIQVKVIIS